MSVDKIEALIFAREACLDKHELPSSSSSSSKMITVSIAYNPVQHDRKKLIKIDRHFTKEKLNNGRISSQYVPSGLQVATVLAKELLVERF